MAQNSDTNTPGANTPGANTPSRGNSDAAPVETDAAGTRPVESGPFGLWLGRALETMLLALMIVLTAVVVSAVFYRKVLGDSLAWYDEVASILLVWVTYFGAALAALRRKHIGFDGVLLSLPDCVRESAYVLSESLVVGFFALMAYGGWRVFQVVEGDNLVSLTWVPLQVPQSVIPIGAVLFIVAELASVPQTWAAVRARQSLEHA